MPGLGFTPKLGFLDDRRMFNLIRLTPQDQRMSLLGEGNFAESYRGARPIDPTVAARRSTHVLVVSDSGLLTFPNSKGAEGKPLNMGQITGGSNWKDLVLKSNGGGVVPDFIKELQDYQTKLDGRQG
jgi:hypothetical protein